MRRFRPRAAGCAPARILVPPYGRARQAALYRRVATAAPRGPLALSIEDFPGPAFVLEGGEGRVGGHNVAFAAWAGHDDPAGLTLGELLPGDPGAARLSQEARAAGAAEHYVERRGRDGEASLWSLRARRIPAGVLVCAVDLTALAAAAHAVHAAERDYVAVAAHELRAPLSAIKAWASALDGRRADARCGSGRDRCVERPAPAPVEADGLGAISRQVDRMNELLTDLFDAARAGAGALGAERAEVAVEALVRRAVQASPHASRVEVSAALPGRALVDAVQVEAVVGRLLAWVAARQPYGPIALGAELQGDEIHLLLDDGGPPLSRRDEGEIFVRAVRSRRGRGLGLYLCQQMAAASGARVFRERVPTPAGARFVLALPAAPAHDGSQAARRRLLLLALDPDRVRPGARAGGGARPGSPGAHARGAAPRGLRGRRRRRRRASSSRSSTPGPWDVVVVDLLMPGAWGSAAGLAATGGLAALDRASGRARAARRWWSIAPSAERPEALDGAERAGALAVLGRPLDWPHLVSLVGCAAAARLDTSHWSGPDAV